MKPINFNHVLEDAMALSFSELRRANLERCKEFRDGQGRLCHPNGVIDWSITDWTNAMAGETGEACNVAKKMKRGDFAIEAEGIEKLAKELADAVTYADLAAARAGIDLGKAVRDKFNEVSDRVGSAVKL